MYDYPPNRSVKKVPVDFKSTLKYEEKRADKVKEATFTFIRDNCVEIVSDDQVYYEGKHQALSKLAGDLKFLFEHQNKSFPIFTVEEYILVLRGLNAEQHKAKTLSSTNYYSQYKTESEILALLQTDKLDFSKSLEQADEFLQHILFRIPDSTNAVKVVARRFYDVKDLTGQVHRIEKEIMLPGFKMLRDYEETLRHIFVKKSIHEKPETYWDVYSRSKAVVQASMVYNPQKELYWCDEFKHYYINDYKEPAWREEPGYTYLLEQHKTNPITFNKLGNFLRSFLTHLFPDKQTLKEVLKWCAFSNTDKLQTYLTLIGPQGIGKNILIDDFLTYYHGSTNVNKPEDIDTKYDEKNAKSTLLFFDEKMIVNLKEYNKMKGFVNKSLAYEEKNKPIYMAQNFANVAWSCNTKDTMSGISRDDRRFKIVPITPEKLIGAPIFDEDGIKVGTFTSNIVASFVNSESAKKEFVLLMLSIRDHVESLDEGKDDINTVSENDARDAILSESRSIEFTEITDVLKTIHNDYNEITGKFGNKPMSQEEKDSLGTIYMDYIPLSKIKFATDSNMTFRVPFEIIRKVILTKASKQKPLSLRTFNRHLDNVPTKFMKGILRRGQERDIELRLDTLEQHNSFNEILKPIMISYLDRKGVKSVTKSDAIKDGDPFE